MNEWNANERNNDRDELSQFKLEVRTKMRKILSSDLAMSLAIVFLVYFLFHVVFVLLYFSVYSLLSLIAPGFFLYGLWKSFSEMKTPKNERAGGLRILRGASVMSMVEMVLLIGLMFAKMKEFGIASLGVLLLLVLFFGFYFLSKLLTDCISAAEMGHRFTSYYNKAFLILLISGMIVFSVMMFVFIGWANDYASEQYPLYFKEKLLFDTDTWAAKVGLIGAILSLLVFVFAAFFIKRTQKSIQAVLEPEYEEMPESKSRYTIPTRRRYEDPETNNEIE